MLQEKGACSTFDGKRTIVYNVMEKNPIHSDSN